jgi:hypothetical protein
MRNQQQGGEVIPGWKFFTADEFEQGEAIAGSFS